MTGQLVTGYPLKKLDVRRMRAVREGVALLMEPHPAPRETPGSAVLPTGPDLQPIPGPGEPEPGTNPAIQPGHDEPPVDPNRTEDIGVPTMATSYPSSMVEPEPESPQQPSLPLDVPEQPSRETPASGEPEWSAMARHSDLDAYLTRSGTTEPEEWAGLTVAEKKAWLDRNG